ncbi:restriction endonuclease subunit S [Peterkaempfera bronchialis]|uniref:restriction endonuclease subunit S n=1 Tax=Peterkaempfera bronchialis TaxID=2126346 RepID=UPI003C305B97
MSEGGFPSDLPKGWARARLGDLVARIEAGKSYKCEPRPAVGDEWGIIKVSAMTWGEFDAAENKAVPTDASFNPAYEINAGDILLSRANTAAYVGASVLVRKCPPRLLLSDKSLRIVPAKGINRDWFAHLLSSPHIRAQITRRATGTKDSMRNISQRALAEIECILPPVEEQRRIVSSLDEKLSQLTSGAEALRSALEKCRTMRHKILADLTSRPSEGGVKCKLGEIADSVRNGISVSRPGIEPDGVPILRIGAVRSLKLDLSDLRYSGMTEEQVGEAGFLLSGGDLLFTRYNGNPEFVGACAVVPDDVHPLTYPDKLIRVRLDKEVADPEFVAMVFSGSAGRQSIRNSVKTTAGQAGISGRDLKSLEIALPPLPEQRNRAHTYRQFQAVVSRLEAAIAEGEARAGHLHRSLLAEAVIGRLIPQDPNDEPAAALLAGIRTKPEGVGVAGPRRRNPRRTTARTTRKGDSVTAAPPAAGSPIPASTQPALDLEISS